jgi:very-short-patch-repair endonuclease
VARSLTDLPTDRAVCLDGVSPDAIALSIEPLPAGTAAIVTYSVRAAGSQTEIVAAILNDLEQAAIDLYPAWLPEAEGIRSSGGAGGAAVQAIALRLAARTHHFGPFIAHLAFRSLRGETPGTSPFSPRVRAAGLARVIAASYGRSHAALLMVLPEGLDADDERALAAAGDWLASHGRFGVWLAGARLAAVDWLETVTLNLPGEVMDLVEREEQAYRDRPVVRCPALAGRPHPRSRAEQVLERHLATRPWAAGRVWNKPMSLHPLVNPVQPDLVWNDERCVVEIDGDDHLDLRKYARDRTRDVDLQLAGYAVLRFTNAQVLTDIETVLAKLERFLAGRRPSSTEGHSHGGCQLDPFGNRDASAAHGRGTGDIQSRVERTLRRDPDRQEPQ